MEGLDENLDWLGSLDGIGKGGLELQSVIKFSIVRILFQQFLSLSLFYFKFLLILEGNANARIERLKKLESGDGKPCPNILGSHPPILSEH